MANPSDLDNFVIGFCCLDFIDSFYPFETYKNIYRFKYLTTTEIS